MISLKNAKSEIKKILQQRWPNQYCKFVEKFFGQYWRFVVALRSCYKNKGIFQGVIPINIIIYKLLGIKITKVDEKQSSTHLPTNEIYNTPKAIGYFLIFNNAYRLQSSKAYVLNIKNGGAVGEKSYPIINNKVLYEITRDDYFLRINHSNYKEFFIKGKVAVVNGQHSGNYFHWITDMLPRFRLLESINCKPDKYIVPNKIRFQKEYLKLLGIPDEKIINPEQDIVYYADELIIPSYTSISRWGFSNPNDIAYLRGKFICDCSLRSEYGDRIYISRKLAPQGRSIENESEIIELLQYHGFNTVYLEDLSVIDQIRLFQHVKIVVAPHGAGITNLIYSCPKVNFIELVSPNYLHPYFYILALMCKMNYDGIVGINQNNVDRADVSSNYSIKVDELVKCLKHIM